VDGELGSRNESTAMAFGRTPEGRRLGRIPPPPRPFSRFCGIVVVDADRSVSRFLSLRLLERTYGVNGWERPLPRIKCRNPRGCRQQTPRRISRQRIYGQEKFMDLGTQATPGVAGLHNSPAAGDASFGRKVDTLETSSNQMSIQLSY
jgi:hypothetical protein